MNELIKKFHNQAIEELDPNTVVGSFSEAVVQRVAELIVWECLVPLWSIECMQSDLALEEYNRNAAKIKLHFGVEE